MIFVNRTSTYQVPTCDSCFRSSFRELGAAALWQKHYYCYMASARDAMADMLNKFGICSATATGPSYGSRMEVMFPWYPVVPGYGTLGAVPLEHGTIWSPHSQSRWDHPGPGGESNMLSLNWRFPRQNPAVFMHVFMPPAVGSVRNQIYIYIIIII